MAVGDAPVKGTPGGVVMVLRLAQGGGLCTNAADDDIGPEGVTSPPRYGEQHPSIRQHAPP
ncbi:hypothetical protein GT755_30150 [Herbidospora sp. NEAU-GS84]|uniref:Uncharacterized protein n=1 Tax=Herbidospora solisilvae TaxID=2696284 RepID=A0A7C9JBL2_9ACTN|nr:hypothetical protein [Herbidospora solisilvae]NAS25928.1 hypothetical protein [Herbidospora solisilvae]